MSVTLEYHDVVNCSGTGSARRSIPTSLALFGMFLLPILISTSRAQISSTPAGSVHTGSLTPPTAAVIPPTAVRVAPPTGISVGQPGFPLVGSGFTRPPNISRDSHGNHDSHGNVDGHHRHHTAEGTAYYPYVYGVPLPYAVDVNDADNSDNSNDDDDPEYQGGPTIFDRRGSGRDSYVPPSSPGSAHARDASAVEPRSDPTPDPPQPPTTLVFKDGRQLEVNNYAIVSQTLYDLTPGHPRKIALADLDLSATQKQNDDRGVVFQLPPSAQAN
jgi:hypothetical protein